MIKIESVTAEILLIWTNVARTKVAWTNVIVTITLVTDIGECWSIVPILVY